MGSLAAIYLAQNHRFPISIKVADILSLCGYLMIFYSIFRFNKSTVFPSFATLVPTIGTVLIILYSRKSGIFTRIFSHRILVGIGLISFSLYLWHQPIFALAKYEYETGLSTYQKLSFCLLVLPLAYCSWRFVEKPFRASKQISPVHVISIASIIAIAIVVFGLYGHLTGGYSELWKYRQSAFTLKSFEVIEETRNTNDFDAFEERLGHVGDCRFKIKRLSYEVQKKIISCGEKYESGILILGDSHAGDLFGAIRANSTYPFIVGIVQGACHPYPHQSRCQYQGLLEFAKDNQSIFSTAVYTQSGAFFLKNHLKPGGSHVLAKLGLDQTVQNITIEESSMLKVTEYLEKLSRYLPVVWFGPRIEPYITHKMILQNGCDFDYNLRAGQLEVFERLEISISSQLESIDHLIYLSQNKAFDLKFPRDFMNCDEMYWADGNHYSSFGKKHFGNRFDFVTYLQSILQDSL